MADRRGNRHQVEQGGFWNSPKVSYSQGTQQLLKEMMKESKLTNFQQRQLSSKMKNGETLPVQCNPTSSAQPHKRTPAKPREQKILNPRSYSGGIRSLETIESSGAYEKPIYRPAPKGPPMTDREKKRLGYLMAYGEDIPSPRQLRRLKQGSDENESEVKPNKDRFDELLEEIDDRRKFLSEMESVGQGPKYRPIVETEISQKIREMEVIDKKQTAELEKIIAAASTPDT
ncbi:UPF0193 protein EVG1 homolog [Tubulanus polymorphus]|uniref:UPF0193 protein EVG1 homolog n=1 Tax=Tubulanus polymorphus TaxID=672921 RepID=UPI003DA41B44